MRIYFIVNAYKILAGKLEGKRPLQKPRWRCRKNIVMDLIKMMD